MSLGFVTAFIPRAIKKSFAVESLYIGVYWDLDCTKEVTSIDWGQLTPDSTNNVTIYIRNEETTLPCFASLWTEDWRPAQAANHITLSWDYDNKIIELDETIPVILTLQVAPNIIGITDFDFKIIILGTEHLIGDINHDGAINILDAVEFAHAFGSTPSGPRWNLHADLNGDNTINILDATMLSKIISAPK